MSYMRAWSLVRTMNEAFREPLVVTHRGGPGRGGASLTPTGERALLLYRKMQQRALRATATELAALEKLLRYR
jgi:molybdate transport system regulatory protein